MQRHCRSVYLSPHHRQRRICMVTDVLFHPDHVIPPPELIAALMKLPCRGIAQALVEAEAGQGEGLVLHLGQGDAGVAVEDVLGGEQGLQGPI